MDDAQTFRHRFCVSTAFIRRSYARSPGYEVIDEDGNRNPNGAWVRRPSGKIIKLEGVCDHPEDGRCPASAVKDPDSEVLPPPSKKLGEETPMERLERILALQART